MYMATFADIALSQLDIPLDEVSPNTAKLASKAYLVTNRSLQKRRQGATTEAVAVVDEALALLPNAQCLQATLEADMPVQRQLLTGVKHRL